jgi:hypothetical protein
MAAQDDARENRLVDLFNLDRPEKRVRHGTDAILRMGDREHEFELKSITTKKGGLTTVRDFGPDHIAKWKEKHWIVALYEGDRLIACKYASPDDLKPWVEDRWNYVKADFVAAEMVPKCVSIEVMYEIVGKKNKYSLEDAKLLQKQQYSKAKYKESMDLEGGYSPEAMLSIFRDRLEYLLARGSTLNNPKVPQKVVQGWATITHEYASTLRELVRAWQEGHAI